MKRLAVLLLFLFSLLTAGHAQEYRLALPGYDYTFPRDHGAHPQFQNEWWYFTGNLVAENGRQFGFKYTIFRSAIAPPNTRSLKKSPLADSQLLLGHFAISDLDKKDHESWERLGRPGFGQAEFSTETLALRVDRWRIERAEGDSIHVRTETGDSGIDLMLDPLKPFVIHGEEGIHRKGAGRGQASHYITYPRLQAEGTLAWRGETFQVEGLAWMDHEFGSNQLGEEEVGWDWFAIQLDSNEELMLYGIRRRDGSFSPIATGSYINAEGELVPIPKSEYTIEELDQWKSPKSGAVYPMGWRISLPRYDANLRIAPAFKNQEMDTTRYTGAYYWEGAIRISGKWKGAETRGKGYAELVGYAGDFGLL